MSPTGRAATPRQRWRQRADAATPTAADRTFEHWQPAPLSTRWGVRVGAHPSPDGLPGGSPIKPPPLHCRLPSPLFSALSISSSNSSPCLTSAPTS
eukprot:352542-Chlamydomonas_euryale.AAC.11